MIHFNQSQSRKTKSGHSQQVAELIYSEVISVSDLWQVTMGTAAGERRLHKSIGSISVVRSTSQLPASQQLSKLLLRFR